MNKKILYAEDSTTVAFILKYQLTKAGYDVVHYSSGVGVTEAIFLEKPDLVILDIYMPEKDGITVMEEIQEAKYKVPVVFLTAQDVDSIKQRCFSLGASDYITKPFMTQEMLHRINNIIN